MKLGLIGLDTSHVSRFAAILNDPKKPFYIPNARIIAAYPGGSPDVFASSSRIVTFTNELKDLYDVSIVQTPEAVAELCDAIIITSIDGRIHLSQYERIVHYRKPVFIDKPFAVSVEDAERMFQLAEQYEAPLMSSSALRYSGPLVKAIANTDKGELIGADCYGPMELEPTNPGFYWYGIHTVEMLYALLGRGCKEVSVVTNADHDLAVGIWEDGRIGTVRGNRKGNDDFGALVHRKDGSEFVNIYDHPQPYYSLLLEEVVSMFRTGISPLDKEETLEIIRFIDAANKSMQSGETIQL